MRFCPLIVAKKNIIPFYLTSEGRDRIVDYILGKANCLFIGLRDGKRKGNVYIAPKIAFFFYQNCGHK